MYVVGNGTHPPVTFNGVQRERATVPPTGSANGMARWGKVNSVTVCGSNEQGVVMATTSDPNESAMHRTTERITVVSGNEMVV